MEVGIVANIYCKRRVILRLQEDGITLDPVLILELLEGFSDQVLTIMLELTGWENACMSR